MDSRIRREINRQIARAGRLAVIEGRRQGLVQLAVAAMPAMAAPGRPIQAGSEAARAAIAAMRVIDRHLADEKLGEDLEEVASEPQPE